MKPTFEPSPMPTQTMNSGSIASGGIGRSSSTTGSTTLRTARTWPASSPSASASTAPTEKPTATPLERGGDVDPELTLARQLEQGADHHPRGRQEQGIEGLRQLDEAAGDAPQGEEHRERSQTPA